ncbi:hypothetical protein [Bradyrhizobium sp. STM 3557]|uniref:hypothetical protein n=1 Tax=Bradyrhizobium sp. STM 3557 TaxID=578920 RepID=UPI00388F21E2
MDLARSLAYAAKVGTKVRTAGGMACFKADEHDYRCAKLHANSGRPGLIVALNVDEPAKQVLDQYCFTIARACRDNRCAFNATFVVARRGMNQMEDTFVYLTEQMKLTHWSKY